MAAAGFEHSTAEMSVVILGPTKGQKQDEDDDEETQPQIYPLVTDDDVSEKQLRRCVYTHGRIRRQICCGPPRFDPTRSSHSHACSRRFVTDYLAGKIEPIGATAKAKRGRKSGKAAKTAGSNQMPVSGVPSPAPAVSGVPSPAPPVTGVPSPAPPISGVPSPAPPISGVPSPAPATRASNEL